MCDDVVEIINKYFDENKKLKTFDKSAQREAGVTFMVLHGCPKCGLIPRSIRVELNIKYEIFKYQILDLINMKKLNRG